VPHFPLPSLVVSVVSGGVVSEVQWVDCVCMSIVVHQLNSIEHICVSRCLYGLSSQPIRLGIMITVLYCTVLYVVCVCNRLI
jgi:hypothetical protein